MILRSTTSVCNEQVRNLYPRSEVENAAKKCPCFVNQGFKNQRITITLERVELAKVATCGLNFSSVRLRGCLKLASALRYFAAAFCARAR